MLLIDFEEAEAELPRNSQPNTITQTLIHETEPSLFKKSLNSSVLLVAGRVVPGVRE